MAESNGKFLLPITFHPITDKILEQLKVLNSAIFPIKYQVSADYVVAYIHGFCWHLR